MSAGRLHGSWQTPWSQLRRPQVDFLKIFGIFGIFWFFHRVLPKSSKVFLEFSVFLRGLEQSSTCTLKIYEHRPPPRVRAASPESIAEAPSRFPKNLWNFWNPWLFHCVLPKSTKGFLDFFSCSYVSKAYMKEKEGNRFVEGNNSGSVLMFQECTMH